MKKHDATKVYLFIEFAASPEAGAKFATTVDWPPVLSGVDYEPSSFNATIFEYVSAGKVVEFPDTTWPNPSVQQTMWGKLQELLAGQVSVDDVLQAMDQAFAGE